MEYFLAATFIIGLPLLLIFGFCTRKSKQLTDFLPRIFLINNKFTFLAKITTYLRLAKCCLESLPPQLLNILRHLDLFLASEKRYLTHLRQIPPHGVHIYSHLVFVFVEERCIQIACDGPDISGIFNIKFFCSNLCDVIFCRIIKILSGFPFFGNRFILLTSLALCFRSSLIGSAIGWGWRCWYFVHCTTQYRNDFLDAISRISPCCFKKLRLV